MRSLEASSGPWEPTARVHVVETIDRVVRLSRKNGLRELPESGCPESVAANSPLGTLNPIQIEPWRTARVKSAVWSRQSQLLTKLSYALSSRLVTRCGVDLFREGSMGVSTSWSVTHLSLWFLSIGRALKSSSISHPLPSLTIGCNLLSVLCCLFWTQIGHSHIRVERSKSV